MWGSKRFDNINIQTPDNWNYYCGGKVNVPLPMESKTWVSVTATAAGSCAPWISIPLNGLPRIFTVVISLTSQQSNQFINLSEQEIITVDSLLYKAIYSFTAFPIGQIQDTVHKKLSI